MAADACPCARAHRLIEELREVVNSAFTDLGSIDVIVNNAGFSVFSAVEEAADEQIRAVVDSNLLGSIHVVRAVLPHLRAQGHGRILQVSTAGGQTTCPNFSYYHSSKWGIEGSSTRSRPGAT